MNKLLKFMEWKTVSGKWNTSEITIDIAILILLASSIYIVVELI